MRLIKKLRTQNDVEKSNGHNKLTRNCKGVTPLIGMALAFAIISMLFGILQTQMVPNMCKAQEASNADYLIKTLSHMTEEIVSGQQTSAIIDTAHYQRYPMLMYPPTPPVILKTETFNLTLNYTTTLPNGSLLHRKVKIPSERIVVYTGYFFYPRLKLMFENTALFKFLSKYNQTLIAPVVNNKTKILKIVEIIGKNMSMSATYPITLSLTPVETGSFYAKSVNLTFPSKYPDGWKAYGNVSGKTVKINASNVKVVVYTYTVSVQGTNVSSAQSIQNVVQNNITIVSMNRFKVYNVSPSSSVTLGVKAVNDLFIPVSGVKVYVSTNNSTVGMVSPTQIETWNDGSAVAVFTAKKPGICSVTFTSAYGKVKYIIRVIGSSSSNYYWHCPHCRMGM